MKKLVLVAIVYSLTLVSMASDTLRIDQISFNRSRSDKQFNRGIRLNPSLFFYSGDVSFSEVGIGGRYEKGSILLQQGNQSRAFSFNSNSFVVLNNKAKIWGTASYENTRRSNITYNNTSDFQLLYPYVSSDSIGGEMKGETYSFSGGYAREFGKWTLAAELSYRATIEYRNVDPRPKNTVSDLEASVGIARTINRYRVAISVLAGKYKQSNSVLFVSDLKNSPIDHLTGLGSDYARFGGTFRNSFYDGSSFGGSIDLIPVDGDGLAVSMRHRTFGYDKQLSDVNNLTLNQLRNRDHQLEISYTKGMRGVRAEISYALRDGKDLIYGVPTGQYYPQIATAENYKNRRFESRITGLFGAELQRHTLLAMPSIGYSTLAIDHYGEMSHVKRSAIDYWADFQWNVSFPKSTLTTTVGVQYRSNLTSDLLFNNLKMKPLTDNYKIFLSSDHLVIDARVRYNRVIERSGGAIFCEFGFAREKYLKSMTRNYTSLMIGFSF